MKCTIIIQLLSYVLLTCCTSIPETGSAIDKNLIIPGQTAEGFKIGQSLTNTSIKQSIGGDIGEILDVEWFSNLKFDSLVYNRDSSIIFLNNDIIIAIAGLKIERRITSDAVLLSRGVDNFILNYGNKGLTTIKKGNHRAYLYKDRGIAIFNDNNDNIIHMFLIFKK